MKKLIYALIGLLIPCIGAYGQVVTTSPDPLQVDATDAVIYFHADEGNKGLMGLTQSDAIYAHTGVDIVSADGQAESWKYAPKWEQNSEKYQLEYVSENLWKLYLGNLREYYGVSPEETITRLCFVFRNSNGSKKGLEEGGGDIFVDIADGGFQLAFRQSRLSYVINEATSKITFTATTTEEADITISINDTPVGTASKVKELKVPYTFTGPGEYVVKATASNGSLTISRNFNMLYIGEAKPYEGSLPANGVTKNADGSYTFCFPAPEKEACVVLGSWNDFKPTAANECKYYDRDIQGSKFRYFVATIPAAQISGPFSYYYNVDCKTNVADPYCRLVLDPSNDRYISEEIYPGMPKYPEGKVPNGVFLSYYADNLLDYEWKGGNFNYPDKDQLVIYEMLFRDFTGTEGAAKGNGTVRQAIEKIPYLKELGINAVELLPINEFNGNISWGYNPNYYFAVDKAYGTPQDYKEFIDKCHEAGIAVLLDVVFNQSDGNHPWYKLYRSGTNPFYNVNAPHAFNVLNDWNQGYPLVEEQWRDMLQFWLKEYRVDGFRFDLVKGLGDNDSYASSSADATGAYNKSRVERMKRLHDYIREVNPQAYFINENLAGQKEENEMAQDGELNWANLNYAGCQYAMGYSSGASLTGMDAVKYGRTAGSTVAYLESHDEERLAYKQIKWGATGVKNNHAAAMQRCGSAAAQMLLVPGSHMIWMFSEMGNAQSTKTADGSNNNTGPKIVNWNLLEDPDNKGLFDSYKELIALRLGNPELFQPVDNFANSCVSWAKGRTIVTTSGDRELYCAINPQTSGTMTITVNFKSDNNDDYWVSSKSYGSTPVYDAAAKTVTVEAGCYAVVSSKNVGAVDNIIADGSMFQVNVTPGTITVSGSTSPVSVWSLSGYEAATLQGDGSVKVPTGIYVVRSGDQSRKVVVR